MMATRLITILFVFLFGAVTQKMISQTEVPSIRVKKESNLSKVVFDNTEFQLMVIDRFGNPKDNRVLSYKLFVRTKRESKEFVGYSNQLTSEMIAYLRKQKSSAKLFFTEIQVKDDDEHMVKLPDAIDTWFPDCKNCNKN